MKEERVAERVPEVPKAVSTVLPLERKPLEPDFVNKVPVLLAQRRRATEVYS